MGMYTELILGCKLKSTTPIPVIVTLAHMLNDEDTLYSLIYEEDINKYELPLFISESGRDVLSSSSYYFLPRAIGKLWYDSNCKSWCISSRSSLKNYKNEIEDFLKWLVPHIDSGCKSKLGSYYAITTYEEDIPKVYYLNSDEE